MYCLLIILFKLSQTPLLGGFDYFCQTLTKLTYNQLLYLGIVPFLACLVIIVFFILVLVHPITRNFFQMLAYSVNQQRTCYLYFIV